MVTIPKELKTVRDSAMKAIAPIRGADDSTKAEPKLLFFAKRTDAGRDLPPYYLVYFLLVDLLGFRNLGQFEKLAWSVPVDYQGEAFLIEHRKFGVGVFARDPAVQEAEARDIVRLIKKGVRTAAPFFDWLASQAVHESKLNVVNRTDDLFERFNYFRSEYRRTAKEAFDRTNGR